MTNYLPNSCHGEQRQNKKSERTNRETNSNTQQRDLVNPFCQFDVLAKRQLGI